MVEMSGLRLCEMSEDARYKALFEKAAEAREAFETGQIPEDLLRELYLAYNPDVEIDGFLAQATQLFPSLNCGLASVYLQHNIGGGEIIHGIYG